MKQLILIVLLLFCTSCQHTDWNQINKRIINEFDMGDIKLHYTVKINSRMKRKGFEHDNVITLRSENVSKSVKIHEVAHNALKAYIKKYGDVPLIVHELFAQEVEKRLTSF